MRGTRFIPAVLMVLVLGGLPLMSGCSGGSSDPVASEDVVFNITGLWNGTWRMGGFTGNISVTVVQTGGAISGSIAIQGSPCMNTATVTGTVSGETVTIGAVSASNNRYDYLGTIRADGLAIDGTWTGAGSCASGQSGTFALTKS